MREGRRWREEGSVFVCGERVGRVDGQVFLKHRGHLLFSSTEGRASRSAYLCTDESPSGSRMQEILISTCPSRQRTPPH